MKKNYYVHDNRLCQHNVKNPNKLRNAKTINGKLLIL